MILLCLENVICFKELWVHFYDVCGIMGHIVSDMYGMIGSYSEPKSHIPLQPWLHCPRSDPPGKHGRR